MMMNSARGCVSWLGKGSGFGSPRLHIMLKREGLVVNHKRTEAVSTGRRGLAYEERGVVRAQQEPG